MVVVLAAMPRELRPLARALRLRGASVGGLPAWRGDGVVAAAIGVGPARARAGAIRVLEEVPARWVVVTGVAGALDTSLKVGDLIRPATVVDMRTGVVRTPTTPTTPSTPSSPSTPISPSTPSSPTTPSPTSTRGPTDAWTGVLATVEHVYQPAGGSADDGLVLQFPEGTAAVDMETAAIAAVCDEKGVPWNVVRAVSDVAGTLTPEVASLLRPDGRTDVAGAARLVLHDPRVLGRLVRLGLGTARAVRAATAAVVFDLMSTGAQDTTAG